MTEREAHELMQKADKKATQSGFFSGPKRDEAAELYVKAANNFKMAKLWKEAGDAYLKAAHMQILLNERDEAGMTYQNAAKCFKKSHPEEAINALKQAVEILTDAGRFHQAANQMKEIAQLYEADLNDLTQSMKAYGTAADWYLGEESTSLANGCLLKVATFAAQLEQYDKAIQVFEQVGAQSLDNHLMRFSVKEYFFKAGLCHLCTGDSVGVQRALERYCDLDPTFGSTREYSLLKNITEAVDNGDMEAYTAHVASYDQISKLDPWKTTLLLRVKKGILEEPALT